MHHTAGNRGNSKRGDGGSGQAPADSVAHSPGAPHDEQYTDHGELQCVACELDEHACGGAAPVSDETGAQYDVGDGERRDDEACGTHPGRCQQALPGAGWLGLTGALGEHSSWPVRAL